MKYENNAMYKVQTVDISVRWGNRAVWEQFEGKAEHNKLSNSGRLSSVGWVNVGLMEVLRGGNHSPSKYLSANELWDNDK